MFPEHNERVMPMRTVRNPLGQDKQPGEREKHLKRKSGELLEGPEEMAR